MIDNFSIELNLRQTPETTNVIFDNFSIEVIVKNLVLTTDTIYNSFSIEVGDPSPSKVVFIRK